MLRALPGEKNDTLLLSIPLPCNGAGPMRGIGEGRGPERQNSLSESAGNPFPRVTL
jgi:hypothetical protein